jgi:hypothetical protein
MDKKPRPMTSDEARDALLDAIWDSVEYWEKESRAKDARAKLEGIAFSILAALDGSRVGLPAFHVSPSPHPTDREYFSGEGQNWFPEDKPDIGPLHEFFHARGRERGKV